MKKSVFILLLIAFVGKTGYSQKNDFIENSGDVLYIAIPAVAFVSTFIWDDESNPEWQFAKAIGLTFIATHGLKRIIDKERPDGGRYSFPSGHSSSSFTGAAFLGKRYGWKVGLPAYLLATYVGYSRIHADKHDLYDVIGGATSGIISAYLFTEKYSKNINLTFSKADSNEYVVGLNYTF